MFEFFKRYTSPKEYFLRVSLFACSPFSTICMVRRYSYGEIYIIVYVLLGF